MNNKCKSTNDVNAMQAQRDQKCPGHSAKEANMVSTLAIEALAPQWKLAICCVDVAMDLESKAG